MTSYIEITESETDPGAPGTSELWKKWRDNPIAMAEGADGAPRVQGIALGGTYLGHSSITTTGWTITDLDAAGWVKFDLYINSSSTINMRFQLSSDNGVTWGTAVILLPFYGSIATGVFKINMQTGEYILLSPYTAVGIGTLGAANAIKISLNLAGAGTAAYADATILSGIET